MFAALMMLVVIALMLAPGIILAYQPVSINVQLFIRIFLLQSLVFLVLGVLSKIFPWMIDPRVALW